MDGMEGAINTVVERLTAALPAKTIAMRTRYDINPNTQGDLLPDVNLVASYNQARLGVEEYPAILVAGLETPSMKRSDNPQEFLVNYLLRAFVWVRGGDATIVELVRFRLTLALRELLMERRTMTGTLMVDDSTIKESFSELGEDDSQSTVGASYVEFNVWSQETLVDADKPPYGPVDQVDIDTDTLPPHPAL